MTSRLLAALADRPLLLDGGMGLRLIGLGLDPSTDDPALWNLTDPDAVSQIHARDIAAGSDAILTNTFGANIPWLARYGREGEAGAINQRAVALARDAAGPARFVLGSIGPVAAESPDSYRAQAEALEGIDALILETHTVELALAGLTVLRPGVSIPILVSLFTPYDRPESPRRLVEAGADAIGVNCVDPAAALHRLRALSGAASAPLLWKPGASDPDGASIPPGTFAESVPDLLRRGVRLFGGCCGATDAHVAAMRSALDAATSGGV